MTPRTPYLPPFDPTPESPRMTRYTPTSQTAENDVFDALLDLGPASAKQLAKKAGCGIDTTRAAIRQMLGRGELQELTLGHIDRPAGLHGSTVAYAVARCRPAAAPRAATPTPTGAQA